MISNKDASYIKVVDYIKVMSLDEVYNIHIRKYHRLTRTKKI